MPSHSRSPVYTCPPIPPLDFDNPSPILQDIIERYPLITSRSYLGLPDISHPAPNNLDPIKSDDIDNSRERDLAFPDKADGMGKEGEENEDYIEYGDNGGMNARTRRRRWRSTDASRSMASFQTEKRVRMRWVRRKPVFTHATRKSSGEGRIELKKKKRIRNDCTSTR